MMRHVRKWLLGGSLALMLCMGQRPASVWGGTIGFPSARQQAGHFRFELVGDSYKEEVKGPGDAEANTGRALLSVALGLTSWSEVFARVGMADFNVDEALFNGDFGFAYGGGVRLRLWRFPFGSVGVSGQYLRLTSDDEESAGAKVTGEWEELDLAVGIGSKRVGAFQFYVGGAYHEAAITLKTAGSRTSTSLESTIPFRLFFGVHVYPLVDFPAGRFLVNIEARLIGEVPQFTLGVQYAF